MYLYSRKKVNSSAYCKSFYLYIIGRTVAQQVPFLTNTEMIITYLLTLPFQSFGRNVTQMLHMKHMKLVNIRYTITLRLIRLYFLKHYILELTWLRYILIYMYLKMSNVMMLLIFLKMKIIEKIIKVITKLKIYIRVITKIK